MINAETFLREMYPNLDEDQYQPAGIDLTLDKLSVLKYNIDTIYGIFNSGKALPEQEECLPTTIKDLDNDIYCESFLLEPNMMYIATTAEKINIQPDSGQFYFPRSSLLRAGIDVRTAFGDPGFNGHLNFLLINHSDFPFFLEKGVRFAQLIDINVVGWANPYDGDYNE